MKEPKEYITHLSVLKNQLADIIQTTEKKRYIAIMFIYIYKDCKYYNFKNTN